MKDNTLRIIPLGGLGEVGKNMMVYQVGDEYIIVDTGLMFPANDMLGIDYIIPDFEYLMDKTDKIKGIIITHGHEDHIGAITHVLDSIKAPIYATPLTRGLIEVKLARSGQLQDTKLLTVQAGEKVKIGNNFDVEFFHVSHSIPDAVGLGILTPVGLVVHTGDYKFDQTPVDNWTSDFAKLAEFSRRGVLALLADSTNAESQGWTPSERVIDSAFDKVFNEAEGRIIIASFASLVSRMQQAADAAARHGRKIAFAGTSMIDNARMAMDLGYLNIPEKYLVTIEQAKRMPEKKVVIMCTGSQGEPRSIMGRLSTGTNRQFDIKKGDTIVLSSQPIPGNEEAVFRTINRLFQLGADVIYEGIAPVHVSGHPGQEEMKLLINLVKPQYLIPIHGELRHLKQHARMAEEMGIPKENIAVVENGQVIKFKQGEMKLAERVPGSYVFVEGANVGNLSSSVVREREAMSRDGIVIISMAFENDSDKLLGGPTVESHGFMLTEDNEYILDGIRNQTLKSLRSDTNNLRRTIIRDVREYVYKEIRLSPRVYVNFVEI
jgi:ribonuclease J